MLGARPIPNSLGGAVKSMYDQSDTSFETDTATENYYQSKQ
jgi:hypothetical protein